MTSPAIEIDGLHLRYGPSTIIEHLDLRVQTGEFLCLLGPSGCGKSTLLRILGDLGHADGAVSVLGEQPRTAWKHLAYVFQQPRMVRWRNGMDNVVLGMQLRGISGKKSELRKTAIRYLDQVHLAELAERPAHFLSGGEQQRVSIARALAVEPKILLMDEPFSALDVQTRRKLRADLVDLWRATGLTIIFVTHDVDEALTVGSRVAVLSQKPTRVLADIDVDMPHPRNVMMPEFGTYRDQIVSHFGGESELD